MRKPQFVVHIALLLALCASIPASLAFGSPDYRGVSMPTPGGWVVKPVDEQPLSIARKLTNESLNATIIARARAGRPDDEENVSALLAEARARPEPRGWDKDVVKFKGGFALLYSAHDRTFAHAFLIVRDSRGSSLITFVGQWRDGYGLDILLDARKVLKEVKNR